MSELTSRQWRFYNYLKEQAILNQKRWVGKEEIHFALLGDYELNNHAKSHDICSTMNTDRLVINESLEYERIILVKDNKFKVATLEETIAEEENIRKRALKDLWRGSLLKAKRLQDGQIIIDFQNEVEKVIETFGEKRYE